MATKFELSESDARLIHQSLIETITESRRKVRRELVKGKLSADEIKALLNEVGEHERIATSLETAFKIGS